MQFDTGSFETVTTKGQLAKWIKKVEASKSFAFDTETTGLDVFQDSLVGIAISVKDGDDVLSAYIPVGHHGFLGKQLNVHYVLDAFRPVLKNPKVGKIFHNAEYDLNILAQPRYKVEVNNVHDTKWMAYTLTANTTPLDMDFLAEKYLGWKTIKFADVVTNRPGRVDFRDVPLGEATQYAAEDTAVTYILAHGFMGLLKKEGKLWDVYNRDRTLIPVLVDMKRAGVKVDVARLKKLEGPWTKDVERLEKQIIKAAGKDFNPSSPQQLTEVLIERGLKLPVDKDGKISVKREVLEEFQGEDAVVDAVLELRGKQKLLSTYVRALPRKIRQHSGRVHGNFNFCGPVTGRASSSDPNLQNIPTRTKDGAELRAAFVTESSKKALLSADYSQIEYRVLAHITQSPYLLHCYRNGIDLHAKMAADVRGGVWQEYNDKADKARYKVRTSFKNVNFAVIYGAAPPKVAYMSQIDVQEAFALLDAHQEIAPEVYTWKQQVQDYAYEHGYVETLFGRRCPVPLIRSLSNKYRSRGERQSVNYVVQGSAADLMRLAMPSVHYAIKPLGAQSLLTVHDELVIECPRNKLKVVSDLVKVNMETAADNLVQWSVPIVAEVDSGQDWREAKG